MTKTIDSWIEAHPSYSNEPYGFTKEQAYALRNHSLKPHIQYRWHSDRQWLPHYILGGQEVARDKFYEFIEWVRSGAIPTLTEKISLEDFLNSVEKPQKTTEEFTNTQQETDIVNNQPIKNWFFLDERMYNRRSEYNEAAELEIQLNRRIGDRRNIG